MLPDASYLEVAQELGCELAALKAFAAVESNGSGFLPNGQPKILFEAHVFSRLTGGKYDRDYPHLSSPVWNKKLYMGGASEHHRLQAATRLDKDAALKSCSWGAFQIMGENWKAAGFLTLQDFINAMYEGELGHLKAFVGFIKSQGMVKALQSKNWKLLAKKYNGPKYYENKYDVKLEDAYKRFLH